MSRAMQGVCALTLGAAIAGLHYIAIAIMRMPVAYTWNYLLVAASIAIAIGASRAGLWLSIRYRSNLSVRGFLMRAAAGPASASIARAPGREADGMPNARRACDVREIDV